MCGIVGYIGSKQAYPIIIKGLKRLEYRGYDSAGIATMDDKNPQLVSLSLCSICTFLLDAYDMNKWYL